MSNLQIKNLPDGLHERLRRRAEVEHLTIRDYVLRLLERDLARPAWDEWLLGRSRPDAERVRPDQIADMIRAARDEHTDRVLRAVEAAENGNADGDAYRP
jgi:antitoxin FitA